MFYRMDFVLICTIVSSLSSFVYWIILGARMNITILVHKEFDACSFVD